MSWILHIQHLQLHLVTVRKQWFYPFHTLSLSYEFYQSWKRKLLSGEHGLCYWWISCRLVGPRNFALARLEYWPYCPVFAFLPMLFRQFHTFFTLLLKLINKMRNWCHWVELFSLKVHKCSGYSQIIETRIRSLLNLLESALLHHIHIYIYISVGCGNWNTDLM